MNQPLLSAALIMRDESANIERCLASLAKAAPLVDGIYIYDTGSVDDSVEKARSLGATVQEGTWENNFSTARNAALAMCTSKFVLIVDLDEEVHLDQRELKRLLRQASRRQRAFTVEIRSYDESGREKSRNSMCRIVRREDVHFENSLHEQVKLANGMIAPLTAVDNAICHVDHHGYQTAEVLKRKIERNEANINQEIADLSLVGDSGEPMTQRLWDLHITRACHYLAINDFHAALPDINIVEQHRDGKIYTTYYLYMLERWAQSLLNLDLLEDVAPVLARIDQFETDPDFRDWLTAQLAFKSGDNSTALELCRRLDRIEFTAKTSESHDHIIRVRMLSAMNCQEADEALACALTLIVKHARVGWALPVLLATAPPQHLRGIAEIILGAHPDIAQAVHDVSCQLGGPGEHLAAAIRESATAGV